MSTRMFGYQMAAPERKSTVFLPFSVGINDTIKVPLTHYLEASIDPPIIEIGESDTNEETTNPPSYAELFSMSKPRDIPPADSDPENHPIASSSRVPAEVTVTTLEPSAFRNS
ncbi:hypothetical protein AYI69_g6752 [Smittium culicis]|uniref:Uncharacterized protein n=1 Tax=Smittium culicis TaxID=133412 RepID=A0A1R1XX21_9FUNG|nr:hypothetical protein AYI69_g6752 [Smittium culicis]